MPHQYDFTKTKDVKRYVYEEVYKKNWYREHGVSDEMIKAKRAEYEYDCKNDEFESSFEDYELEYGYCRGEVYVSYDEFLDNDIENYKELIKTLKQPKEKKFSLLDERIKSAGEQAHLTQAPQEKRVDIIYFEDLVVKHLQKIQKKIKKVTPDEYDEMWLGLFDQIKVAYRKADQSYLSNVELVKTLQTLNAILNDNSLTFPNLVQQALDYMTTVQALEVYVAAGIATDRLTERTNAILNVDTVDGNSVVYVDLCYDNDASLPVCDAVCLFQQPATEENVKVARELLSRLTKAYHIPISDKTIMTPEKMQGICATHIPFDTLVKNAGIFEFYEDRDISIGISREDDPETGEDIYIFNLFVYNKSDIWRYDADGQPQYASEYINVDGAYQRNPDGSLEDAAGLGRDIFTILSDVWNENVPSDPEYEHKVLVITDKRPLAQRIDIASTKASLNQQIQRAEAQASQTQTTHQSPSSNEICHR